MKISFKVKLISALSLIIILVFSLMGIFMTVSRLKELHSEILAEANIFVRLSYDKIGDSFIHYYKNAFFKFRSMVIEQMALNRDLRNIQIIDLDGKIWYDLKRYEEGELSPFQLIVTDDEFVLNNLKKMEINIHTDDEVCIIAPYIDEYGVHNYSVVYYFSIERLKGELVSAIGNSILVAVSTIVLSIILSVIVSNRITGHLLALSEGARRISEGDFNNLIDIKTGDEFEDLAAAFNYMTVRIREHIWQLNDLVKELEKRDTQKTQFLANISHELRTPLTASMGYVDYLKKEKLGPLNQEQKHSIEVVWRNLERLNKEIHSLLQVSKFALEGIKLKYEVFQVPEIIENIIDNLRPEINYKRLSFKKTLNATGIYGDKENLHTVFENLINNSIKFADPNTEIEIVSNNILDNNQEYFQFKISNRGKKIPEDQLEKIFEPFYQVDVSSSRKYGGIGLGLSIVKNIIEAHQGKIWAESREGLNVFYFLIPQRRAV